MKLETKAKRRRIFCLGLIICYKTIRKQVVGYLLYRWIHISRLVNNFKMQRVMVNITQRLILKLVNIKKIIKVQKHIKFIIRMNS